MLATMTPVLAAMNQTVTAGPRSGPAVGVSAMADSLIGRRLCRNRHPSYRETETERREACWSISKLFILNNLLNVLFEGLRVLPTVAIGNGVPACNFMVGGVFDRLWRPWLEATSN